MNLAMVALCGHAGWCVVIGHAHSVSNPNFLFSLNISAKPEKSRIGDRRAVFLGMWETSHLTMYSDLREFLMCEVLTFCKLPNSPQAGKQLIDHLVEGGSAQLSPSIR